MSSSLVRPARPLVPVLLGSALALALVVVGCAGDEGISPFAPARGIAGTWVRVAPPMPAETSYRPSFADTLVFDTERTGRWSRLLVSPWMAQPQRIVTAVSTAPHGPVVRMWDVPEACPTCNQLDALSHPAPYVVVRRGSDHLEVRLDPEQRIMDLPVFVGGSVARYERRRPAPAPED